MVQDSTVKTQLIS